MSRGSPVAAWEWRLVRCVLSACTAAALVVLTAGSASAHVALDSTDPVSDAVLVEQPAAVTLTFAEPVEANDTVIEVFDDRFNRVDTGPAGSIDPQQTRIRVGLRPALAQGTYTVSWHASSADTHVESGTFQFSVGRPSVVRGTVPDGGRNDMAGVLLGALRWTGYLGLVLGPGVLLTTLTLWPAGLADRRTRKLTTTGLTLLVISTLGSMLLQGFWASGQPFSALWSAPDKLDTHSRKFDEVYAVRSCLLLGFAAALTVALSRPALAPTRSRRALLGATTVSAVALLATWPLAGHSASGDGSWVAIAANLTHTFAMTVWLGGLVLILVGLRPGERAADLAAVLPRFSRVALASVAALVVTGVFMAWREVGSVDALTATTFGRLLLTKLLGVVLLIPLGDLARRWVKRRLAGALRRDATPVARPAVQLVPHGHAAVLMRGLTAELVITFGVLAVTAALVVIAPPR